MLYPKIEKKWIWDQETNSLVQRSEVMVQLIGNRVSVFAEEGPLYVSSAQEIFEAVQVLRERLQNNFAEDFNLTSNF